MPNFCERIAEAAGRFPDRPAIELVTSDRVATLTYADLLALSGQFAAMLRGQYQIATGDRIAILAANDGRWIAAYLGVLRLGAVAVPLDTAYTAAQVSTVLRDCQARVLCVSDRLAAVATDAVAAVPSVGILPLTVDFGPLPPVTTIEPRSDSEPAAILYTSGTTADPKGVVLTHGNLEAERASALGVIHVTEHDAVLGVLPLFHALAQMANLLLPLSAGARVVFLETVNSTALLDALEARGITIFACVPQFFYLIHQRVVGEMARRGRLTRAILRALITTNVWLRDHTGWNPGQRIFRRVHAALGSRMRLLITGGSRFDPTIARDLYGFGLTLLNGYGLTETSGAATLVRPRDRFTTSVGQPLPGVEVRIAPDAAGTDADGADGDSGEILLRGPVVMKEYFARPDATREVLDAEGWLRTGDLGRVDRHGRVFITGRKKEVIVLSSGKNLYPEEIEAHYRQSPFVKEICVMGLTEPGSPSAERLHAVVVPDDGALRERGAVNLRELIRFELEELSVKLPAHKRILGYDVSLEPLPRTTTGKLKRREIERQHRTRATAASEARALTADEEAWLRTGSNQPIVDVIAQRTRRGSVRPDDNLELDLQLDSMERVELLTALERHQGTRVAPEVRATLFTVRQLVDAVTTAATVGERGSADDDASTMWESILAAPPDADISRLLSRPTFWRALVFYSVLQIAMFVLRLGVRVRVGGRTSLPTTPFIVSPNHQSYLDAFVITAALPFRVFRQLFFVGAAEYFQTPLMAFAARALNIVPVDPDANLVNAMRAAATGLRLKKVLILFPEGERAIDGEVRTFRKGAAILARHLPVPIVPVAVDGLFAIWPRGRRLAWRRLLPGSGSRIAVEFGAPITVGDSYADGTSRLRTAVVALLARLRAQ